MPSISKTFALGAGAIVLMTLVAYIPALGAGFIWDDDAHFSQNTHMESLAGLRAFWTTADATYYPFVSTTFWIERRLWGLRPFPYHLVNVLFHAIDAILLWLVLRRLNIAGAWLGAALFALHPVQVESVAWVTEMKNTESCLFYLLAILSFLRWQVYSAEAGSSGAEDINADTEADADLRKSKPAPSAAWTKTTGVSLGPSVAARLGRYALTLALFALALLSKPSTIMLPVVLLLCVWWLGGRWSLKTVVALVPFFALSALAAAWTVWEQKFHSGATGADWSAPFAERLAIAGRVVWFYLEKILWPHPLMFIYPRWRLDAAAWTAFLPTGAVILAMLLLWLGRRRGTRPAFFAFAYFLITLFPVLGFFNVYFMRYSFVGDHFQYLACIGPLALIAAGLATACMRLRARGRGPTREENLTVRPVGELHPVWPDEGRTEAPVFGGLYRVLTCALLVLLGALTFAQSRVYKDPESLWRDTLAKNPEAWMARTNLGNYLRENGRLEEAMAEYSRALEVKPDYAEAHNNLGLLLARRGALDEAIAHYLDAVRLKPDYAEAYNNLGVALRRSGRIEEAIARYNDAIRIYPGYVEARTNLGVVLASQERLDEAISQFAEALRWRPDFAPARTNLDRALAVKASKQ